MKKTYRELTDFINAAALWQGTEKNKDHQNGKFAYAVKKMVKRSNIARERYFEEVEDVNVKHCSVDSDKNIIQTPQGQYRFTKDAMIERLKELRTLSEKTIDIDPFIATVVPDDLTPEEIEAFTDFVIKPPLEVVA